MLAGEQRAVAEQLLTSEHPYDCCDLTIAECLAQEPVCRLSRRLADAVCRQVAEGHDVQRIRRALSRRARSMLSGGEEAEIDLAGVPSVGRADAPVTVVVYACGRCPFCSKLLPELHAAVDSGELAGTARMLMKTFPGRGHPYSSEVGLAFMAAAEQGRFWEYVLLSYTRFDEFSVDRLGEWAEAVSMERARFERQVADPALREALVAFKKEGIRNGVEETPAVFLNGRRFLGEVTLAELVDVINEELDRVRGLQYVE